MSQPQTPPATSARPTDQAVLAELGSHPQSRISFQGLRRRLDLHPQALQRTLRRLESSGLVARDGDGYRSTRPATTLPPDGTPLGRHIIACTALPPGQDGAAFSRRLRHRWFQGLTWYGEAHQGPWTTLTWLAGTRRRPLRLHVARHAVCLEMDTDGAPDPEGVAAAGHLLGAIGDAYHEASRSLLEDTYRPRLAS